MGRALAPVDLAREDERTPVGVEATVVRHEDDVLGTRHAEPGRFEALSAGGPSETAFSGRVLDTPDGGG